MRFWVLGWWLAAAGCAAEQANDGAASDSGTGGATGTGADGGGGTDEPLRDGYFLEAAGTFNGSAYSVGCDESTPEGQFFSNLGELGDGRFALNALCVDPVEPYGMGVTLTESGPGTFTTCDNEHALTVSSTVGGGSLSCNLSPPTAFELDIVEWEPTGDGGLVWAGRFELVASDGVTSVDVSGSFRVLSAPPN